MCFAWVQFGTENTVQGPILEESTLEINEDNPQKFWNEENDFLRLGIELGIGPQN